MVRTITIDFETKGIERRPEYPPKPVGVAIRKAGDCRYMAWGHPVNNNCSIGEAHEVLEKIWNGKDKLLFHNAKFDLEVAEVHFKLAIPEWQRIYDTMFELFLFNPNAKDLQLKPSAERILGLPPTEQDAVRNWLIEHHIVRADDRGWGAHIADAPGDLVGLYSIGDVERTYRLHEKIYPFILDNDMGAAYDRERRLMPILLRNEQEGVCLDVPSLEKDRDLYGRALATCDDWLRKRLNSPGLNLNAGAQVAAALKSSGVVTKFPKTQPTEAHPDGQDSVAKKSLAPEMFEDSQVASAYGYRQRLKTCLTTFIQPWLENVFGDPPRLHTGWNQVKSDKEAGRVGARTGRLSCSPNFQNIPKNWYNKNDGYTHPAFLPIPELPLMRRYIIPDDGDVLLHRDYNQQELRVLAHFEDGQLAQQYTENPRLDFHQMMKDIITNYMGKEISRDAAKILDLAIVYGMGVGKMAMSLRTDVFSAREMRQAQKAAIPGLGILQGMIAERADSGKPVRTWGGRLYYKEDPILVNGVKVDLGYKLLNTLIQGSSADITKEAIVRYDAHPIKKARFLLTVHDELDVSSRNGRDLQREDHYLKESMESIELGVPMLTDGKCGPNLAQLEKVEWDK